MTEKFPIAADQLRAMATEPKSEQRSYDMRAFAKFLYEHCGLDPDRSGIVAMTILSEYNIRPADEIADLTTANVLLHASLRSREEETASLRAQLQEAKEERDDVRSRYVREIAIVNDLSAQLASARKALEAARWFVENSSDAPRQALRVVQQIDAALTDEEGDSK